MERLEDKFDVAFTVFTPTYNRAHTLDRVYESLRRQTFRDFEWLVVDDGSTDYTERLVEGWQDETDVPVRYVYQENQGKHVATNEGVRRARGRFFLTLDSDDRCVPTALERFYEHWAAIPDAQKPEFSAVTCLCKDEDGYIVGDPFPEDVFDATPQEMRYRYGVAGEKWGFQRTDVMRDHPFPKPEGTHVPENVVWNAIGRRYKTRFVNEALRIYHVNEDEDSLSDAARGTAEAHALSHRVTLNEDIRWLPYAPLEFLRSAVHFARFSFHDRRSLDEQWHQLSNPAARALWVVGLPLAFAVYASEHRT